MREHRYQLKEIIEGGEPNPYKGEVVVKLLSFAERTKAAREMNFELDKDQNVASLDPFLLGQKLSELVAKQFVSMEVKKGDQVYTELEDLDFDESVGVFYGEVGGMLLKGINLGKI